MLENKILVNFYILSLGKNYEIFVPVNEKVGNITKLLNNSLFEDIDSSKNNKILNAETGIVYNNNTLIRTSDIKNGTRLLLI